MKDAKRAEIKRVLMGRAILADDGRLIAVPAGTFMKTPIGIGDGATAVRFLGMSRRIRRYETKDGRARVNATVTKAMQNIGRGLILNEQPEATACLIRYILTRPAVLVFTWEDGTPTLTAWTGRGLTGCISLRRAIKAFEKGLPDTMTANEIKVSEEEKKTRKEQKEEKKRKRAEKKAEKKAGKKVETGKKQQEQADKENAENKEDEPICHSISGNSQEHTRSLRTGRRS